MNIQQIQYLLEVQRTGSFTQAGKNLYTSQASISKAIRALENELGAQIFVRDRNGAQVTERGAEILEYAGRMYENYRRMSGEDAQGESSKIRMCFGGCEPLNRAFVRLLREIPEDGRRGILQTNPDSPTEKLLSCELELYLCNPLQPWTGDVRQRFGEKGLDARVIHSLPAQIQISEAHPLYKKETLTAKNFRDQALIDRPDGGMVTSTGLKAYIDINRRKAQLADDVRVRRALFRAGLGYRIAGKGLNDEWMGESVRAIELEGLRIDIMAVTNAARPMAPEVCRFLELAQEELSQI